MDAAARQPRPRPGLLLRAALDSGVSEVRGDPDKFLVLLDVKPFGPEDLAVAVRGDFVEIRGQHGERQDDLGCVSREFCRRYRLPADVDQAALSCSLAADGTLTLWGPRVPAGGDAGPPERPPPVSGEEVPGPAPSS